MVKADAKHDYYADLELPSNADSETIKKQFRLLAKQYHPDRNPGREIEVIPKFQAIQAANEILSDPVQKKKYDSERASQNASHETSSTYTSNYKKPNKPAPPPPPPSNFPPPPKRNPNLNKPFGSSNARPAPSASADKFAQFTRAAPQQWDRAKFEDAAKAETLRNLHNMRPQSQGPPPRPPPRAAPTAPRPPSAAGSPDGPYGHGPPPVFPGLSRTNSGHRRHAFAPGTPGVDEAQAPTSAYAHVHRSDRPPPQAAGYSYTPGYTHAGTATSPPVSRARPSVSPLRTSKSSGFDDIVRPGLQRSSSRPYASTTGERTNINEPGLTRSASVRNSPTGQKWEESGPFGGRPQKKQNAGFKVPPPRHHSSSPRGRTARSDAQFSDSETSSSEDQRAFNGERQKATPRKPRQPAATIPRNLPENDPALTGQFPKNNYTRINENKYQYPTPDTQQRYVPSNQNPVDDITQGLNNAGIRQVHRDDVPLKTQSSVRPNGSSSEPQSAAHTNATFSAADWDGQFSNGDAFRPTESTSRSRSPTKAPRPKLPSRSREEARTQHEKDEAVDAPGSTVRSPGIRHVSGMGDGLNKAASFQAGKFSAEDWAQRLRNAGNNKASVSSTRGRSTTEPSRQQPVVHDEAEVHEVSSAPYQTSSGVAAAEAEVDAMDVDEAGPSPASIGPGFLPARKVSATEERSKSTSGVDLNELKETAPFKPNVTGLGSLGDLNDTLPFESRAAEELNLHQPPSAGAAARHLNLPAPPKPVPPPPIGPALTQESWTKYSEKMARYMDEWNLFNCKMIEHFRVRQEQIGHAMYSNWITAIGDGAAADDFDGLDFVGKGGSIDSQRQQHQQTANGTSPMSQNGKHRRAGYATYMEWIEQDRMCRTWWDVAFEEHAQCMKDLGKVRSEVKSIWARERGKHKAT